MPGMGGIKLHYTWRWDMPAPPQRVWPLVSDTHAFNRAAGIGPWAFVETPDPLGGSVREGILRSLGARITWDEKPFNWVDGQEFSVLRVYHKGPFLRVLTHLNLEPSESGSTLTYSIEAEPRSRLWSIIARYYLGVQTHRHFHRVFSNVSEYLGGIVEVAYPQPATRLSSGGPARLRKAESSLVQAGLGRDMAERLIRYIEEASDDSCHRIRPYALADTWGEDREATLRLCLHATRLGLFDLTWDIICPLCRGDKDRVLSLSDLRRQAHCSSCNIQFDANFDRSVEVTFRPSRQIRQLEMSSYCVGGPGNTAHVVMQQIVVPGETVALSIDLAEGTYRLRGPQISDSALIEVRWPYPVTETISISCSRLEVSPQRIEVAPGTTRLSVQSLEADELLVMLEKMQWPDDVVTAAQVTALQDFRDLFSSEVLSPEEQFEIRHLTFMFTDLRSSTALYQERGDAPAFALVRDHFEVLHGQVADHHGAVVKTIGDSVMAVFCEPADAVAAGLDIHKAFSTEDASKLGLVLKVGVHAGPCVAVNLNGRLDYFGTTVNAAVRLEGYSLGNDVVVQANLLEDPSVRDVLARPDLRFERSNVQLKGFQEAVDICRITRDSTQRSECGPDLNSGS